MRRFQSPSGGGLKVPLGYTAHRAKMKLQKSCYTTDGTTTNRIRDYDYDYVGNLLSVTESEDSSADVSYSYDALNRVTSETSAGVTHQYQYDLNGNRTNAVYGVTERQVAWTYDALNRISSIVAEGHDLGSPDVTEYFYDLNSKPVKRIYPTVVTELRTFDPMGRLLTMTTTNSVNGESFTMEYEYDLVGSALKMEQNSWNLDGQAQDAVTLWSYDDRYRLTNETVVTWGGLSSLPTTNATSYTWDAADNRLSKTIAISTNSTFLTASTILYSNNALNQITGYEERTAGVSPATNVVEFVYDANGSRTNKTETIGGTTSSSSYVYDEDNRLVAVAEGGDLGSPTHTFAYDYRSRRYFRSTPSGTNLCVFDGGLSIQEYSVSQASSLPSTTNLRTEFVRGEGMGGGVGGMVYSLKHPDPSAQNQEPSIICSHANHRGDVIARSDMNAGLTSFALYEAYGTRPYEWGTDPDNYKANTKYEEFDLGMVDDGMRWRDLITGTYITRDPIGYTDGPNVYCYVHCNPITKFDALGLTAEEDQAALDAAEKARAAAEQAAQEAQAAAEEAAQEAEIAAENNADNAKEMANKAAEAAKTAADAVQEFNKQNTKVELMTSLFDLRAEAREILSQENPNSIKDNKEYGGLFYRDDEGKHHATPPAKSRSGTSAYPENASHHVKGSDRRNRITGDYHTHGDYSKPADPNNPFCQKAVRATKQEDSMSYNSDKFSRGGQNDDYKFSESMNKDYPNHMRSYLGTPGGAFLELNPVTRQVEQIN